MISPLFTLLNNFDKFSQEKTIRDFDDKVFTIRFQCEREPYSHKFEFYLKFNTIDYIKKGFQKIGQFPAFADLKDYKTKKYKNVLKNDQYTELNKAIGLVSHGIGIGSFVYFRRIFENLIFETYNQHKDIIDKHLGTEQQFKTLKMDKKIEALKSFIPLFLYENKNLYGIMSKGIHELKEKECLELHTKVELGIKLILEDKLNEYEKVEMLKEYKKQ